MINCESCDDEIANVSEDTFSLINPDTGKPVYFCSTECCDDWEYFILQGNLQAIAKRIEGKSILDVESEAIKRSKGNG